MQSVALRALEFDRIRDRLSREACTPLGRRRLLQLEPATDGAAVHEALALAAEASRFVRDGGSLGLTSPEDLPDILERMRLGDEPLEPLALVGLANFVESIDQTTRAIRTAAADAPAGGLRRLGLIAGRAPSFHAEAGAVRRAIEPTGEVKDDASPALREIRDGLRRERARLRATLEGLTRGRETSKYLQDSIVTDRHGRYVLVVRAEHRGAIPGLVHGSSASGASLYVEPLSTVELNNDILTLVAREAEEIRRILLALTRGFRDRPEDLQAAVEVAAALDELHAKTRLAHRYDGVAPELVDDGRVEFRGARHPLLLENDAGRHFLENDAGRRFSVVATDLLLLPPTRALVISGPNTGGKTVALKAFGLLALMAQAGILIPVESGSRFTPFRSIFADIGDDQSIAASLSTFSARIANLVGMNAALELPALVLLDEVGSGTDPIEGGALGAAVIEHFRRRGACLVVTTHDETLKSYATSTEGVDAAAFGFDPDSYKPTYRLRYGVPGRSLALEIAERLGMPLSVIADARARRSGRESLLAAHLSKVDKELAALHAEREALSRDRDGLAEERKRILERESRLVEREAVLKRRLDDRLNEKLREARAEVDRVVGELKSKAGALADRSARRAAGPAVVSTGEIGGLRRDAREALDAISADAPDLPGAEPLPTLTSPPEPGDTVTLAALGVEAIVRRVNGDKVDVEVRGKRMRVGLDDLRAGGSGAPSTGGTRVTTAERTPSAARDLVVIGLTVDEALDRAGKFLDDALVHDERRLRVVHGHGTGRLRESMRAFFRTHPLVSAVARAADNEGGDGATVIELKD